MDISVLKAQRREAGGRNAARRVRADSRVPGVLYGHKQEVVPLSVPTGDVVSALESGARLVTLDIEGASESALIKEVQYDALGDHVIHVDFARVDLDEKVTVHLEILLHGTAAGTQDGGVVDHPLKNIEVECLARAVPENLVVEIADLQIGDAIHVRDLTLPEGMTTPIDDGAPVVVVHPPTKAEEPAPAEAAEEAPAEPERVGEEEKPAAGESEPAAEDR